MAAVTFLGLAGCTLLLSGVRWFSRPSLAARLAPYTPSASATRRAELVSVESLRDVLAPLSAEVGGALARMAGVGEALPVRLARVNARVTPTAFRLRQVAVSLGVGLSAPWIVAATGWGLGPALIGGLGAFALAFLAIEQRLAAASLHHQEQLRDELPVVAEQMGMLLGSGWSLGGAIHRIATRGHGACASDLERVGARVHQGLGEIDALREWAELSAVDSVERLVGILELNREATDLDDLIAREARAMRRAARRRTIESIERRSQQVWVPVTVAALVPGVMLMGVPFVDAMHLLSG